MRKSPALRRGIFLYSVITLFQPIGVLPEGLFFLPSGRLARRLFCRFNFPVAGWLRGFKNQSAFASSMLRRDKQKEKSNEKEKRGGLQVTSQHLRGGGL